MATVDTNKTTTRSSTRRTGRQAPPRAGAAAAAAASKNDKGDSKGEDDDAGSNKGRSRQAAVPAHIRKASVFRRLSDRLDVAVHGKGQTTEEGKRSSTEMDGWVTHDDIADAKAKAEHAIKLLRESAGLLEELGADFNPLPATRRRSTGRSKIQKGSVVRLKDKFRDPEKGYGDLMDAEEMDALTVQDVRGQKLVLTTPDGGKLFLPKGNVELVAGDGDSDDDSSDGDE